MIIIIIIFIIAKQPLNNYNIVNGLYSNSNPVPLFSAFVIPLDFLVFFIYV